MREVLQALKNAGIKLNIGKSKFFVDQVNYLGYIFNSNGVHPDKTKVSAILEAPKPCNIQQLQSFIGLANFYSRFVPNFSTLMHPLY